VDGHFKLGYRWSSDDPCYGWLSVIDIKASDGQDAYVHLPSHQYRLAHMSSGSMRSVQESLLNFHMSVCLSVVLCGCFISSRWLIDVQYDGCVVQPSRVAPVPDNSIKDASILLPGPHSVAEWRLCGMASSETTSTATQRVVGISLYSAPITFPLVCWTLNSYSSYENISLKRFSGLSPAVTLTFDLLTQHPVSIRT